MSHLLDEWAMEELATLQTGPVLAARITRLLWWGRRITKVHRWLDNVGAAHTDWPKVSAGLTVFTEPRWEVDSGSSYAKFWTQLSEGHWLSFDAGDHDGDLAAAHRRWRGGDRRNMTMVAIIGGLEGNGPGREDGITITYYNEHGVGQQTIIEFDHSAYRQASQERQQRGWEEGGEDVSRDYCTLWAQEGEYRVQCGAPVTGIICGRFGDHVKPGAPVRLGGNR